MRWSTITGRAMAGEWIPIRTDLHEDPAVIGIALAVNLDEFSVVGRLIRLWSWASHQTQDGFIPFVTPEKVDQIVQRRGFSQATADVGWLLFSAKGLTIPNFSRWMGQSAKRRLVNNRLQQARRESDVSKMSSSNDDAAPSPCTVLSSSVLSCDCSGGEGGAGEGVISANGLNPPTAATLAWFWCHRLARKKHRAPQDHPEDVAGEFQDAIDRGEFTFEVLFAEINRKDRVKREYLWQFWERLRHGHAGALGQVSRVRSQPGKSRYANVSRRVSAALDDGAENQALAKPPEASRSDSASAQEGDAGAS